MSRIDNAIEKAAKKRLESGSKRDESCCSTGDEGMQSAPTPREGASTPPMGCPGEYCNPFLITADNDTAPAAEQYGKLKSTLLKLEQLKHFDKSLMVTSATGEEGKTLTSLNLAISLAQEFDHTVLLVEADIRSPSIMNYLNLKAGAGLTDCVLDGTDVGEVLVKTGIGKLSVLPAGRAVPNPVELFSSRRMQELLSEIKSRYQDRYVIIDTTPILPFAEPQYIANSVGGVLFVVREGYTSTDKMNKGLAMLKNHNVLGVVCNAVRKTHSDSRYGYYGYYRYN
jgi:exopolysaccharide/PEP-CTERM locus tyrosine autokinase